MRHDYRPVILTLVYFEYMFDAMTDAPQPTDRQPGVGDSHRITVMQDASVERSAAIALLRLPGVKWGEVVAEVGERGSAVATLRSRLEIGESLIPVADIDVLLSDAAKHVAEWEATGIGVHAFFEDSFPSQLRDIREMPPVVFTRGRLVADRRAVAVVGKRAASDRGLKAARHVATALARNGVTVVSGLAAGVDTAAHRAALDAGGRTVAVIGTGVDKYYPSSNVGLQREIVSRGLVLSQFWPDSPPSRQSFPMRNIVMSGYAAATIIVEATEHSGTRIQARAALKHGRSVILLRGALQAEWAQGLEGHPGVSVVNGYDELMATVEDIFDSFEVDLAQLGPVSVEV